MHVSPDFTKEEILHLDPELLSEALTLFYELVAWVDNDVFTDSPERAESVAGAEEALHLAHQTMRKIEQALDDGDPARPHSEHRANRVLDEAEEAFGARSMARERAACGSWDPPETVSNYLFWIEDEATLQEESGTDGVYTRALRGIADELRALGFAPAPAPWEKIAM